MLEKLNGLVLKQRNIGENDRMLVLLTKEKGVLEVCARGVKRMRSPLAAGCMPLCYSEFCLFEGKKYITVDAAHPPSATFTSSGWTRKSWPWGSISAIWPRC